MLYGSAAIFASLGFGVLFNIRGNKLFVASLIGGLGGIVYEIIMGTGQSAAFSLFWASCALSLASEIAARMMKTPVTTFLVCALIPLVPGGGMYYTVLEVVQGNVDGAVMQGLSTIIQACSIVIGVTFVSSCMRMIMRLKNRKHA